MSTNTESIFTPEEIAALRAHRASLANATSASRTAHAAAERLQAEREPLQAELARFDNGDFDPAAETPEHLTERYSQLRAALAMNAARRNEANRAAELARNAAFGASVEAGAIIAAVSRRSRERIRARLDSALASLIREEFRRGPQFEQIRFALLREAEGWREALNIQATGESLENPRWSPQGAEQIENVAGLVIDQILESERSAGEATVEHKEAA